LPAVFGVVSALLMWLPGLADACQISLTGTQSGISNSSPVDCISISNANITGDVNNTGSVLVSGITVTSSRVSGAISNIGSLAGGTGVVGNTIVNGGALAPGNSIGTLAVQGNLAFTSAASYMIEVSQSASDRTNVTGTATLAGTVRVVSSTSLYVFNSPYTILSSAGLGGTQFNAVATPAGISGR
jgi:hypothetical protein